MYEREQQFSLMEIPREQGGRIFGRDRRSNRSNKFFFSRLVYPLSSRFGRPRRFWGTLTMLNVHLIKVIERIPDFAGQLDLSHAIQLVGGWRGIFDPYSTPWHTSTVEAKVDVLDRILRETGVSLKYIVRAFQEDHYIDQPDVADSAIDALYILFEAAHYRGAWAGWTSLSQGHPG
jgi:hypothetical protein